MAATSVLVGVHFDATTRKERSLPSDVRERVALMCGKDDDVDRSAQSRMFAKINAPERSCNVNPPSVGCLTRPVAGSDDDVDELPRHEERRAQ